MDYNKKILKYKQKYLDLNNKIGGSQLGKISSIPNSYKIGQRILWQYHSLGEKGLETDPGELWSGTIHEINGSIIKSIKLDGDIRPSEHRVAHRPQDDIMKVEFNYNSLGRFVKFLEPLTHEQIQQFSDKWNADLAAQNAAIKADHEKSKREAYINATKLIGRKVSAWNWTGIGYGQGEYLTGTLKSVNEETGMALIILGEYNQKPYEVEVRQESILQ